MGATGIAHVFDRHRLAVAIDAAEISPPTSGEHADLFFKQHGVEADSDLFKYWPDDEDDLRQYWINECLPSFATSRTSELGRHFIAFYFDSFYMIPEFAQSRLLDLNQVDHAYPWSSSETWCGGWNAQRLTRWLPVIDRFRNRADLTRYRWDNWSVLDRIRKLPSKCEKAITILLQNDDAWESWIDLAKLAKNTVETDGILMLRFWF